MLAASILVIVAILGVVSAIPSIKSCRFAPNYSCRDFQSKTKIDEYLSHVMYWEGQFAKPGIGYDPVSGYTYDGHPIDYKTGELYGDPHLFSAPSKESIHIAILALAVDGNMKALEFVGGESKLKEILTLKINGYNKFNENYPGYGCYTPWVGFDTSAGIFKPLDSWSTPYYKVPGLDNGEWFWGIYALVVAMKSKAKLDADYTALLPQFESFLDCQKKSAKYLFYLGNGDVPATTYIKDVSVPATDSSNYMHCDGYLNDPYEGETMTHVLYLFSDLSDDDKEMLWTKKQGLFEAVNYTVPTTGDIITVQKGWWFSTHEQWKTLLLPYLDDDLPLVQKIFRNAEKARTWDAATSGLPGLMASINDVTDGGQDIPSYASACGVASLAYEKIERRDLMTPYGSYGLFLHDQPTGFCWYNNMLQGPRMQSKFGSTEAINANSTEISPLTTWDSKITTVLAMLGGVGHITKRGLEQEPDATYGNLYKRFVYITQREHERVFGSIDNVLGEKVPYAQPKDHFNYNTLSDWELKCA